MICIKSKFSYIVYLGILCGIKINLGVPWFNTSLCKEDKTNGLVYSRILTRIFDKFGVWFDGIVRERLRGGDHTSHDAFEMLHLVYYEDRWLFARNKFKFPASLGYFQPNFIHNDVNH